MRRPRNGKLGILSFLGCLACLTVGHSRADVSSLGRVFFLDLEHGSKGGQEAGFEAAANACIAQGAQVASGADLHQAVSECAFSVCSRGWLSGPVIGTTVCSSVQGTLRPVTVQLENVTRDIDRLGVFCVKDSDAQCGQPPSFPNSYLQGKTGLDLGDELLYACNQEYKLRDGQTEFSLFCDSCAKWYGIVQDCLKDDPEGHIDYEDKFTDGHLSENPRVVHQVSLTSGGTVDHEIDKPTSEPERELTVMSEANEDDTLLATEPAVSQLSQKHMFWFPSEAFQDREGRQHITTDPSVKIPVEDQSHMTDNISHQSEVITEEYDSDYDHATDSPTEEPTSPSVGSTEDSWVEGFLFSQGGDKGGLSTGKADLEHEVDVETFTDPEVFEDATKSSVETGVLIDSSVEEHIEVTKHPEDVKYEEVIHVKGEDNVGGGTTRDEKPVGVKDNPVVTYSEEFTEDELEKKTPKVPTKTKSEAELELDDVTEMPNAVYMKPTTFITLTTTSADDDALHKRPMMYTPSYAPENVSTSQQGLGLDYTATPSGMVHLDSTPVFTDMTTPIMWETNDNDHFLEHVPDHSTGDIPDVQSEIERDGDHSPDPQEGAGESACAEDPCHASGRGPMVAAIIVGIAAAVVGVVLGVWCYKKRQQKSSHYQLNGTNRQTQSIELQQTV
ncbi:Sushi domain-containing protein 5 [Triplophysa tibetana]|uniref:Sushi domain-containing protein 5 n=1 Tax=Triplophysa tibetana TaxID=1572043 RepID=A0A5A9NLS1_9TELE|nr:Sushi domain-containing protein 5 [Triplophysa tibetana]